MIRIGAVALFALVVLCTSTPAPASDSSSQYQIIFEHGDAPADDPATDEHEDLYECQVTVQRQKADGTFDVVASFRGSIIPDDPSTMGTINDGQYDLNTGFHHRKDASGTLLTPTAADLVVKVGTKTTFLVPCLVVNGDQDVPCTSGDPNKTKMSPIHVHNGFKTKRYSDGCQTIMLSQWSDFMQTFLTDHPDLGDWYSNGTYFGSKIGTLVVRPKPSN